MVDREVEEILREIRDRVLAEQEEEARDERSLVSAGSAGLDSGERIAEVTAALDHLDACLVTTTRTWDRLPPIVSNRDGAIVSLELRIKSLIKRLTRWFTWEQVNFNAAVNHALRYMRNSLSQLEQRTERSRLEYKARDQRMDAQVAQLRDLITSLETRVSALDGAHDLLADLTTELRERQANIEGHRAVVSEQLAQLAKELRERDEQLMDEQRVCFKQLALELSEVNVLQDRSRRHIETRLDELEKIIMNRRKGSSAG